MKILFCGDSITEGTPGASYVKILQKCLPEHTLVNFGKGGDTIASLLQRIRQEGFEKEDALPAFDLIFVWIGINEIFSRLSWRYSAMQILRRQARARTQGNAQEQYQAILTHLTPLAPLVIAASPALMGENPHSKWNEQVASLSNAIELVCNRFANVRYVNLHTAFIRALGTPPYSDYMPKQASVIWQDVISLPDREAVDQQAAQRGLKLTLDGVHLNGAGADLAASIFLEIIQDFTRQSEPSQQTKSKSA